MIQDIFLPEKIGEYYIFSQRIVGIDITKSHVNATLLKARGSVISIEKQVSEKINGAEASGKQEPEVKTQSKENLKKSVIPRKQPQRTIAALSSAMKTIGKVDQVRTALPSSQVVFKELRMPFTTADKINMVIRFEVEPLLPFPAQEAVIDFIITDVNEEQKSSLVLVAAVQKQHMTEHLSLFEQAGINPTTVTVDMFALYGLYTQIPAYSTLDGTIILLDMDMNSTRIVAIDNHQLRIIRTLPYGITAIAKDAGGAAQMKPSEAMDYLMRFDSSQGTQEEDNAAVATSLTDYFNKIQFALSSTIASLKNKTISKILLVGVGAEINGIESVANSTLELPCELFDIQQLSQNKRYRINKKITLSPTGLISVATGTPCPITQDFNLAHGEFEPNQTTLLVKQVATSCVLMLLLFGSLITNSVIQAKRLKNEIYTSEQEAVEALQERFVQIPEDEDDLDDVIEQAKSELASEEEIWMAFSSQARASFLEYLLELSTRINKQQLGFKPEKITITEGAVGEITLKATVRDFEALKQLEQVLRQSKLFSYVEGQTTPDFSMKIVVARTI